MMEVFRSGGVFMWPILVCGIVVVVLTARSARSLARRTAGAGDGLGSADAVLFWGVFAAVLGTLGTLGGIAQIGRAVERAGDATPELLAGGVVVSLLPVVFGVALLLLALLLWFVLRLAAGTATSGPASVLLLPALFLGGCGFDVPDRSRDSDQASVVRDSAGVAVVENPAADRPLPLTAVHVAELVPPDRGLTAVPWGVVTGPTGLIHVADWTGARVVTFDDGGAYVGTLGREGSGPGELRSAAALALDGAGRLVVWDTGRGVLSRWSAEGGFLGEERAPLEYWGHGFAAPGDGYVAVTSDRSAGTGLDQRLVHQTPAGEATVHSVPLEMTVMRLCGATAPAPRILAPSMTWTTRGDTILFLNGPEYRIDVHVGDRVVSSVRRAVDPIRVSERSAVAAVESGPGAFRGFIRSCGVTAAQIVDAVGYEEAVSPVMALATDPRGRLWVARTPDGIEPGAMDVFDPSGQYLGTLDLPALPVGFPSDSSLLALRLEPSGLPVVHLYRLEGGLRD